MHHGSPYIIYHINHIICIIKCNNISYCIYRIPGRLGFVDAARGLATQFSGESEKARETTSMHSLSQKTCNFQNMYLGVYIHTYIHIYIYIHTRACACSVCVHVRAHAYVCMYLQPCICIFVCICICTCVCVCAYIYIYISYLYIYIHMMCVRVLCTLVSEA